MYADLHIHTTASDGIHSPSDVVSLALLKGFSLIAITDHDSVSGLAEGMDAGASAGLDVIPGIELSTLIGKREIHILGYFIDPANRRLQENIALFIETRRNRAVNMVKKLNKMGCELSLDRVKEIAGSEFIGRPHIAHAMVEKGYISDIREAFTTKFIGRGGEAYVERFKYTPREGIDIIADSGGIPVLAHPGYLSDRTSLDESEIRGLVEDGIRGIEVYYRRHKGDQIGFYRAIAGRYNLLVTGGSDFHGNEKESMLGKVKLPLHYVEAMKEQLMKRRQI